MKRVIVVSVVIGFLFASLPHAFAARPMCYGRRATIVGNARDNVIRGTRRADVIVGRAGDDRILGRGGRDRICGGSGDDMIHAARGGRDRINCGPGDDTAVVTADKDRVAANCETVRAR